MNPARLRYRIEIQEAVKAQDQTTGVEIITSWKPVWQNLPASIEFLSVKEYVASKREDAQIVARIMIRYKEGLTPDMRIVNGEDIYDPDGWLPDNNTGREYLTAPCALWKDEG